MARPLSEDRRRALLEAAAKVFAEQGMQASTAAISKTAKVSEGSLFTYFKTKEELVVALYQELRLELAAAVMNGFPTKKSLKERLEHVFFAYVTWGAENPVHRKALRQVSMSKVITGEVRAEGNLFAAVDQLEKEAVEQKRLTVPLPMVSQVLKAMAEMTMELCARTPAQAEQLKASGFQMLWGALTSKP